MLTEDQRIQAMYTGLSNFFNTERILGWSRNQTLTAVSLAGVSLFITQSKLINFLAIFAGLAICAFWAIANRRTQARIHFWQERLKMTEPPETYVLAMRVFTEPGWENISKPMFLVPYAMSMLPLMFLFMWILLFLCQFSRFTHFFLVILERIGVQ